MYLHTHTQNTFSLHIMCWWQSLRFHFLLHKGRWGLGLGSMATVLVRVQTLPVTPGQQKEDEVNRSSSYRKTIFELGQETGDADAVKTSLWKDSVSSVVFISDNECVCRELSTFCRLASWSKSRTDLNGGAALPLKLLAMCLIQSTS